MIDDNRHRDVASDQDRAQGVRLAGPTGRDTRLPRWQWQLLYVRVFCSTWPRAPVLSSPSFARLLAVLFGARTNRWCAKGDILKQYTRGITDRNATVPVKVNWILKFDTLCQAVLGSRGQTSESLTSLFCLITEDWIIWNERSGRSWDTLPILNACCVTCNRGDSSLTKILRFEGRQCRSYRVDQSYQCVYSQV